jgi:hypothetical protein
VYTCVRLLTLTVRFANDNRVNNLLANYNH